VTQRDLLGAFDSEVLRRSRLLTRVRTVGEAGGEVDYLELPQNHHLLELDVTRSIEGKTVAQAALRSRFGISVLAVKRMGKDGVERRFVPAPSDRFEHGDVLVLLGTDEALASFQEDRALPVAAEP
jgi:Trk K+ transport system NAD-binding subunit